MLSLSRWLIPSALAAAFAFGVMAPAPALAGDDLIRVIVNLPDVVIRAGHAYYRYGDNGYNDRLIVERDRYGRPVYYRYMPRDQYGDAPPYGNAYGYHRTRADYGNRYQRQRCDSRGRCRVEYYDPRYSERNDDDDDNNDGDRRYSHGHGHGRGHGHRDNDD